MNVKRRGATKQCGAWREDIALLASGLLFLGNGSIAVANENPK